MVPHIESFTGEFNFHHQEYGEDMSNDHHSSNRAGGSQIKWTDFLRTSGIENKHCLLGKRALTVSGDDRYRMVRVQITC